MTDEPEPEPRAVNPERLRSVGALIGVPLTDDRAAALVPQAEQHFALLRQLDARAGFSTEPAAEFRLDRLPGSASD